MPLAIGAGTGCGPGGSFERLPHTHNTLFYYWAPDAMFNSLQPIPITFPATNRKSWRQYDMSTTMALVQAETVVSTDMSKWAPEVTTFLKKMWFGSEEMNELLANSSGKDWSGLRDVACEWIKQHEDVWRSWVPVKTSCLPGQGMFSAIAESFVQARENASTCQACPPGRYSALIGDDIGDTAECRVCQPGFSQSAHAAVSCTPCAPGTFSDESGSTLCQKCGQGEYQDREASAACRA